MPGRDHQVSGPVGRRRPPRLPTQGAGFSTADFEKHYADRFVLLTSDQCAPRLRAPD